MKSWVQVNVWEWYRQIKILFIHKFREDYIWGMLVTFAESFILITLSKDKMYRIVIDQHGEEYNFL